MQKETVDEFYPFCTSFLLCFKRCDFAMNKTLDYVPTLAITIKCLKLTMLL